jgi:cytochrome b
LATTFKVFEENIMQHLKLSSTVRNLLVDTAIFGGFLLATDPHATGQAIHEWLGIAFGATIIVHLLLHWKWIVNVVRRFFSKLPGQVRINSLLNSVLFIAMTLIIFSGLMISKVVLSTFGLTSSHDAIWRWLHTSATNVALIIVGLHVALHWKWIVSTVKRYVWQPLFGRRPRASAAAALKSEQGGVR